MAIKGADDQIEFLQKLMQFVMDEGSLEKCSSMPLEDITKLLETKLG